MNSLVRANVVAYRRRYSAVIAAITIGVAFLTATLFVNSTVNATLGASVGQNYQRADLVVEPKAWMTSTEKTFPVTNVVKRIQDTDGVESTLQVASTQLSATVGGKSEGVAATVTDGDPALFGTALISGAEPALGETTISESAAKAADVQIGSTVSLSVTNEKGRTTTHELKVSGLRVDSQSPSTSGYTNLQFTQATAKSMDLTVDPDLILARLASTTSAGAVAPGLEEWMIAQGLSDPSAGSPEEMVTKKIADLSGGVDALTWVLGAFAGIALVVTVLVVTNTFSVILAQRTRELALLRTLGARRKQIRSMVLGEAVIIGLFGGILGAAVGTGVVAGGAAIARTALNIPYLTFGFSLSAVVVGVAVGLVVTILASLRPALAATKVSPLAALRPAETVTVRSKAGTTRVVFGLLLVLVGAAALTYGVLPNTGGDFTASFGMAFLGGLVSFIGVLVLGTLLIPWAVRQLARPFGKRIAGRLAGLNALRHPQRTSAIGTALLLGVTLVALMLVGATSARSTLNAGLAKQFPIDLVISSTSTEPLTSEDLAKLGSVDGIKHAALVSPVAATRGCPGFGKGANLENGDPDAYCAYVLSAPESELRDVMTEGAVLPKTGTVALGEYAFPDDVKPASVQLTDGQGRVVDVPVDPEAATPATKMLMTDETRRSLGLPSYLDAPVAIEGYVAPGTYAWLKADDSISAGSLLPSMQQASGKDLSEMDGALPLRQMSSQIIDTLLLVVSALLAVAVVIALIGVSNTLSLSVIERTRENSLLRALGLTKRQLRGMLALEAALIAGAAAVLGIVLGAVYGLAGARAATSSIGAFAPGIPWLWLAVVLVISVGAAILASVWPARRAARMSPVEGLAVE